jgi:hypothetical protein
MIENNDIILFALMLIQVGFTLFLMVVASLTRFEAVRSGRVALQPVPMAQQKWSDYALKAGIAMNNQFETPILFYVLSLLALFFDDVSFGFLIAAAGYVFARFAHSFVLFFKDHPLNRLFAFGFGVLCLFGQIIILATSLI